MEIKTSPISIIILALISLVIVLTGCGDSSPSLQDIPLYPDASPGESMGQSGFVGGNMEQYTTTDSFDDVIDFYTGELNKFNSETMSHTSELGRQTAFSIPKKAGAITVAVQEFTEEGNVNITIMAVGF